MSTVATLSGGEKLASGTASHDGNMHDASNLCLLRSRSRELRLKQRLGRGRHRPYRQGETGLAEPGISMFHFGHGLRNGSQTL